MADLIERESLNKWCHETMKAQTTVEGMSYIRMFWDAVNAVPNVDAVPVVRCKECAKRYTPDCAMQYQCSVCGGQWSWESDDAFCSWGERGESNELET